MIRINKARKNPKANRGRKAQSALEYLIIYSWALLLVAAVMLILYFFVFAPSTLVESTCIFSGGTYCQDMVLGSNSIQTSFAMLLTNTQNYAIANVMLQLNSSSLPVTQVSCSPSIVLPGGAIICSITTLPQSLPLGSLVTGKMILSAIPCPNENLAQCQTAQRQNYTGSFITHTSPLLSATPLSLSITANQLSPAANGDPDMISATVTMLGATIAGATVSFTQSGSFATLAPSIITTDSNGNAFSYISSTQTGNTLVTAQFASTSANILINFITPAYVLVNTPSSTSGSICSAQNNGVVILTINSHGYTCSQFPLKFPYQPNTQYTYCFTSPVQGPTGTQYAFNSVTGCGLSGQCSTLTAGQSGSNCAIYDNYTIQYSLTETANPTIGGNVLPGSGWYNTGSVVTINAIANPGYYFTQWSGTGIGSYSGTLGTSPVTMQNPITEQASFQSTSAASYIYCVGTDVSPYNQVYYAPISSTGVGTWTSSTTYPVAVSNTGCSIYNGYIYCVGTEGASPENYVYYAPISSTGIGTWTTTTNYPVAMFNAGCSIYNGYLYCVGTGTSPNNYVYYTPVSSTGIGTWSTTTNYPITMYRAGCSIYNGYLYCVGTYGTSTSQEVYYAPISSTGVGTWTSSTNYPITMYDEGCSISNGYIYCVGTGGNSDTQAYYAQVSSTGVGTWTATTSYPIHMCCGGCSILNGYIYCVGTEGTVPKNYVYYAPISSTGVGTWIPTTNYPVAMGGVYCQIPGSGGGWLGGGGPSTGPWGMTMCTTIYFAQITLTNSQSSATSSPFQQMLTINSLAYQSYINPTWNNVEFTTGQAATGSTLQAWVEAGASNTATNTVVWVNLPNGIGANSNTIIYMDFMGSSVMSSSGPTGEAPQLSGTYGQYDNGNYVFNFYDGFKGTSLSAKWSQVKSSGGSVAVNNGATFTTASSSDWVFISSPQITYPNIAEADMVSQSGANPFFGVSTTQTTNHWYALYSGYDLEYDPISPAHLTMDSQKSSSGSTLKESPTTPFNPGIWQVVWSATGSESSTDGVYTLTSSDSTIAIANYGIYLGISNAQAGNWVAQWARMRAYPPSGVMPSISSSTAACSTLTTTSTISTTSTSTTSTTTTAIIPQFNFCVIVAKGPTTQALPTFQTSPAIPSGYGVEEQGVWSTANVYAYGTSSYQGQTTYGITVAAFPSNTPDLNTATPCSSPYASQLSIVNTTLTVPANQVVSIGVNTDDAMEVYYKPTASGTWSNIFNGAAWKGNSGVKYGPTTATFNTGNYNLVVMWINSCSGGQQALSTSMSISGSTPCPTITTSSTTTTSTTITPLSYIYCIGSSVSPSNQSYYAAVANIGLGTWQPTSPYPINAVSPTGCSIYSNYIYCVGDNGASPNNFVYYAPISSTGIGTWTSSNPYPISFTWAGCSIYNGYIYCVGPTNNAYYTQVSSTGVGTWTATTSYPISLSNAGCSILDGYIYCVGSSTGHSNQVYYAPVSSTGIGTWTASTFYPWPVGIYASGCSISNSGYIYCVSNYASNLVYYAPITTIGIGAWQGTTSYPGSATSGCAIYGSYLYCVGGSSQATYYAQISSTGVGTWTQTLSYPLSQSYNYCQISGYGGGGWLGGGGPSSYVATTISTSTSTTSTISQMICPSTNPAFTTFGYNSGQYNGQGSADYTLGPPDGWFGTLTTGDYFLDQSEGSNWTWDFGSVQSGTFNTIWSSLDEGANGDCAGGYTNFTQIWYASPDGVTWTKFTTNGQHQFIGTDTGWGSIGTTLSQITGSYRYIRVSVNSSIPGEACSDGYTYVDSVCVIPGSTTTSTTTSTSTSTSTTINYIYCVGTATSPYNQVYYAPISSTGVGTWTSSTIYPVAMTYAGCSIYNGYIYCVGTNGVSPYKYVYYAPISSTGVGTWTTTASYPIAMYNAGCSAYNGYIYCVGTNAVPPYNPVYYAPISSTGTGTWSGTTNYPVAASAAGCSIYNGYIYCVGTQFASPYTQVYYAPISSTGVGTWIFTTSYPIAMNHAGCSIYGGYIYCVGSNAGSYNQVYYAPISSTGVGTWSGTTNYPVGISNVGCSIFGGYIYCVGTYNIPPYNLVYYAPISSTGVGTWANTASYPVAMYSAYCEIPGSGGGYLGGGGPD